MERLWGEVVPVPEANIRALAGGEEVLGFHVSYTPGHASHHVSFFHAESGRAFVGDTACVRIPPSDFVLPPTPPPDIDLELWLESLATIEAWEPSSLGLTHFGAIEDVPAHLATVRRRLAEQAERARTMDAEEFERALRADVQRESGGEEMLQAVPPEQQWAGLHRYWEKREEKAV
jgi:glyoxylase-like metal-dependent hydrolase (beta-lactamase superfamily II)